MVMVQRQQAMSMRRQSSTPGTLGKQGGARNSLVSCAMGDEDDGSLSSISTRQSSFSSMSSSQIRSSLLPSTFGGNKTTTKGFSYNHQQHVKAPKWVHALMCIFTALSWVRAIQYRSSSYDILSTMDAEIEAFALKKRHSSQLISETSDTMRLFSKEKVKLKKTQRLFQHETRMLEEMAELEASSANDNVEIPQKAIEKFRKRRSGNVAKQWIEHRQDVILQKIYNLQAYIQEQSRKRVIEKYGNGPHQVVFHVKSREGRKPGRFTVRMAPLSTVPHSIETFLDQVSNNIWDNTILYSHNSQNHVVAAAPLSYGTFESKEHELETLGFKGVTFPEYSEDYPHKKYTLGFVDGTLNFYINAFDNSEHHGPSNQPHHELEGDSDPCFAEIIEGFGVLQDMQYGRHKGATPGGWEDYDITRIMKAQIEPWP